MAKRPAKPTEDQLRADAKAFAERAVKTANANRAKIGHRPLPPRESIRVFQAALAEAMRRASAGDRE